MSDNEKIREGIRSLCGGRREDPSPGFPERKKGFVTGSNAPVKRLYTPLDLEGRDYLADQGFPGEATRTPAACRTRCTGAASGPCGSTPASPRPRNPTSATSILLEQGQTGLSVAFDLPTQIGYDSDHALSQGEVGKVGVAIDSLADMEILFDGIPLDKVSTSMTINAPASVLLAMYIAVAEKQGVTPDKLERHDPERHPQGVCGPRDLHLPARAVHAPHHGHLRILLQGSAQLEHDIDLRLPHPRGGLHGRPGSGLHARGRHRLCRRSHQGRPGRGRVRPASFLLLQRPQRPLRGGRQVPRGSPRLGQDNEGALQGQESQEPDAPLPYPDRRFHAYGSAAGQQRRARNASRPWPRCSAGPSPSIPTPRTRPWRLPTEASVRVALRTQQVIAHESGAAETGGSAGRLLLRGEPDEPDRGWRMGLYPQDRLPGRGREGHRERLRPAGNPGRRIHLPDGRGIRRSGRCRTRTSSRSRKARPRAC